MNGPPKIPIIDISSLRNSVENKEALTMVGQQIKDACIEHGFFYITGHGVSIRLQEKLEHLSKLFFAKLENEKIAISMQKGGKAWRGYFPVGNELTSGKPDMKEGIYFGQELDGKHPKVKAGVPLHGANLFPESPAELSTVVLEYMKAVTEVGHVVLEGIAVSLDLPVDYFSSSITKDPFILFRIFHYPAEKVSEQTPWGVGEHTDYGLLTILKQDNIGGLQVKSNGQWIDAPPIDNTFICNIGDMLDRMTGGVYLSTPHRVKNTSNKNRLSFPLFFDPGFDVHVKPIFKVKEDASERLSNRWDKADVYAFDGPYGDYLINKVSQVFPELYKAKE